MSRTLLAVALGCAACTSAPRAPRVPASCTGPTISRFAVWDAEVSKDGSSMQLDGAAPSALAPRGAGYAAHVAFQLALPTSYGTINVPLRSRREDPTHPTRELAVDLGASRAVTLTYSSTADLFLQIRHGARAHGGHHYRATLPSTGGAFRRQTLRFADFAQPSWVADPDRYPLDLHDVFSFTVAALKSADVTVSALEVDGFVPSCD